MRRYHGRSAVATAMRAPAISSTGCGIDPPDRVWHASRVSSPIAYRDDPNVDLDQLASLIAGEGWFERSREVLAGQVSGARWVVSAWDGVRLVGFAPAISDGVANAYVSTVVVAAEHRGRGSGRAMIERLVGGGEGGRRVLHARAGVKRFDAKVGFPAAGHRLRLA